MYNRLLQSLFLILLQAICINLAAQHEFIAIVDPATGNYKKVSDSIAGVRWLIGGNMPAYSELNKQFTFPGMFNSGGPMKLYTVNTQTGKVVYSPPFPNPTPFASFRYAKFTNQLYAITNINSVQSLVKVDPQTGLYNTICSFPGVSVVLRLMPGADVNTFFAYVAPPSGSRSILTVNVSTGVITSQVNIPSVNNIHYHPASNKFYALRPLYSSGPGPVNTSAYFCSIDAVTGVMTDIVQYPGLINYIWGNDTFNEDDGKYYFAAQEFFDTANYLYTINITNGAIMNKVQVPQKNIISADNLVQFRYDHSLKKMYALLWEANTLPPTADPECNIDVNALFYPNPFLSDLVVEKRNVTTCTVRLSLFNMLGQQIMKDVQIANGINTISLRHLPAAMYVYRLYSSTGKILLSGKLIKQ